MAFLLPHHLATRGRLTTNGLVLCRLRYRGFHKCWLGCSRNFLRESLCIFLYGPMISTSISYYTKYLIVIFPWYPPKKNPSIQMSLYENGLPLHPLFHHVSSSWLYRIPIETAIWGAFHFQTHHNGKYYRTWLPSINFEATATTLLEDLSCGPLLVLGWPSASVPRGCEEVWKLWIHIVFRCIDGPSGNVQQGENRKHDTRDLHEGEDVNMANP